jgi:N-acyl-D-amino-acid deacylase
MRVSRRAVQRALLLAVVLSPGACSSSCEYSCSRPDEQAAPAATYDLVIANGRVVDGTGAPWFEADIGIVGDRIRSVGDLGEARARARIDAAGMVVAPGFIDLLGQSEFNVLVDNRAASKITQGVTTEITGEGASIAPVNERMIAEAAEPYRHYGVQHDWRTLAEYFARLERSRTAINLGTFVGSGGIRDHVIGKANRPATAPSWRR